MKEPMILTLLAALAGSLLLYPPAGSSGSVALARTAHTRTAAHGAALPVVFPGPERGVAATQAPAPTDFVLQCDTAVTSAAYPVGGMTIPAGAAVRSAGTCLEAATLYLDAPGAARFQAMIGVADNDPNPAPIVVPIRVVSRDGYESHFFSLTLQRGAGSRAIDLDVSGAAAVVFTSFPNGSASWLLYQTRLTGTARALRPVAGDGSVLPAGATPVDMAAVAKRFPACAASAPLTVTLVRVPAAGAWVFGFCRITLPLTPSQGGTLVLRYGSEDRYGAYRAARHRTLYVQVLDAAGRLLREASGPAFAGGGLRPLWIDLRGGSKLMLSASGSVNDGELVVTAAGILSGRFPVYNPSLRLIAGGPGAGVLIDPEAFILNCNAGEGSSDASIARTAVPAYTYIGASSCSTANLILDPDGHGVFHARFGLSDAGAPGAHATVTVVARDRAGHVLAQRAFQAVRGAAGVPIDVPVDHVSVLSFAFSGSFGPFAALLYDIRLSGPATVYGQVCPPTESPLSTPHGMAIDPHDFTAPYAGPSASDDLLVRDAALAGWALSSGGGAASLPLGTTRYPRHLFSARIGIPAGAPADATAQVRFSVLDGAGHVLRQSTQTTWYAYGPRDVQISLSGGATLRIEWVAITPAFSTKVDVYAMTAS